MESCYKASKELQSSRLRKEAEKHVVMEARVGRGVGIYVKKQRIQIFFFYFF
jgi:hypothetical protein